MTFRHAVLVRTLLSARAGRTRALCWYAPCTVPAKMHRLLAAAVLAAGCSSVQEKGPEQPRSDNAGDKITDVDVEGNEAISEQDIVSGLETRPPDKRLLGLRKTYYRYYPYRARSDVERITSFYARRGFFDAEVEGFDVRERGETAVEVVFTVDEGAPSTLIDATITGVPDDLTGKARYRELRGLLDEGERYRHENYLELEQSLRSWLVSLGYLDADVRGRVEVNRDRHTVSVGIDVDPGALVRVGETRIEGLDRIPERAVRARLPWREGDVLTRESLDTARGRLYALGYFGSIDTKIEHDPGDDVADVVVRVSEASRREIRVGGGFAIDESAWETRVRLGYVQRSFLHPLVDFRFDARPAYRFVRGDTGTNGFGGTATAEIGVNDIFHVPLLQMLNAGFYRDQRYEGYDVFGPGGRISFDWRLLDDHLRLVAGWTLQLDAYRSVAEAIELAGPESVGIVDNSRVGYFEQSVAVDGRDSILAPRRGYYALARIEEAGAYAGSEWDYVLAGAEARGYVPLGERVVLAARIEGARKLTGDLPITRRLFLGGAVSHRGFAFRRLAPFVTDPDGDTIPVGGDALVQSSVELRFDVVELWDNWVGLVAFLDVGDVTESPQDIDFGDLHYAVGPGLRYDTIVGPIRLDLGIRLNNTGAGEPPGRRWAVHFSLGEAF